MAVLDSFFYFTTDNPQLLLVNLMTKFSKSKESEFAPVALNPDARRCSRVLRAMDAGPSLPLPIGVLYEISTVGQITDSSPLGTESKATV